MIAQSRRETNYAVRQAQRGFDEGLVFADFGIRQRIKATTGLNEHASGNKVAQIRTRNPVPIQFSRPECLYIGCELNQLLFSRGVVCIFHRAIYTLFTKWLA